MKIIELEMNSGMKNMDQEVSVEQDQLLSIVSNGQRGRIDEQRCSLGPRASSQGHVYNQDPDEFFQLMLNSQSRRLDDQRLALSSLPGTEAFTVSDQKEGNTLKTNFDQFCSIVSRAHSFRRRTPPNITLTPGSPASARRASFSPANQNSDSNNLNKIPPRSSSFSPISDKDRVQYESFQGVSSAEEDQLLFLVSQAQHGRMDEQRCSINPLSHSPKHMDKNYSDQDPEQFFKFIANSQNRRLDDQRVSLKLPGKHAFTDVSSQESDQLFSMVSRLQGSRIDDQRCSAPHIQLGTPVPPRKSQSQPISQTHPPSESGLPSKSARRSTSFSPDSEIQNCIDQDKLFSLVHHVQRGRMDDQRCTFEPNKTTSTPKNQNTKPTAEDVEQFFKLVSDSQSRRLDDQRVTLSSLPGLQYSSAGTQREKSRASAPQIVLTPASPATPQKSCPRPASPTLTLPDSETLMPVMPPPRSASFSPVSDKERLLYDDMSAQITFQISMCFPPQQRYGTDNQQCQFPEVFLTVGQSGETFVLPLSPKPGRPISLHPVQTPRNHRSRSASPHRSRQGHSRPSSPSPGGATSPISPHEDYFSLIQRVHTAQLQKNNGRDGGETSREVKKGKGKSGGRKEKKEGGKRK